MWSQVCLVLALWLQSSQSQRPANLTVWICPLNSFSGTCGWTTNGSYVRWSFEDRGFLKINSTSDERQVGHLVSPMLYTNASNIQAGFNVYVSDHAMLYFGYRNATTGNHTHIVYSSPTDYNSTNRWHYVRLNLTKEHIQGQFQFYFYAFVPIRDAYIGLQQLFVEADKPISNLKNYTMTVDEDDFKKDNSTREPIHPSKNISTPVEVHTYIQNQNNYFFNFNITFNLPPK